MLNKEPLPETDALKLNRLSEQMGALKEQRATLMSRMNDTQVQLNSVTAQLNAIGPECDALVKKLSEKNKEATIEDLTSQELKA